uniref:Uncharacterized protein n=1 Tax=Candidatus Kentrum sp. LPFa TaxID=2126335 RepID=A0A450XFP8_9GAMM|nr:MAG: hypothetical protein BECKLPF1236A_GA0070988_106251 [Candidatus Kentron sp. LPFa]VFK36443.1 MAG: hypothetical protein BECKLPF1236C_GA0070990_106081 [Candidatus Kentron sp. LPFa]
MNRPSRAREEAKTRFLATLEVVRRELVVLDYSDAKLFSAIINTDWVRRLNDDMAEERFGVSEPPLQTYLQT